MYLNLTIIKLCIYSYSDHKKKLLSPTFSSLEQMNMNNTYQHHLPVFHMLQYRLFSISKTALYIPIHWYHLLWETVAQVMLGSQLTLFIFAVADVAIILFHSITFLVLSTKRAVKFIFCLDYQQKKIRKLTCNRLRLVRAWIAIVNYQVSKIILDTLFPIWYFM